jgi:antitoxin (DNA-binding transcriptional repressor) of toxin-antitoxin stability system
MMPSSHGGSRRFKSCTAHHLIKSISYNKPFKNEWLIFVPKRLSPEHPQERLRPTLLQIGGEAETKISSLLSDIEKNGKSFTICRNGKPVAELIPYRKPSRLVYNPVLTRIQIHYDPPEDHLFKLENNPCIST